LNPRAATLSKPVPERETPRVLCHGLVASDFLVRTSFPVPLDLKVHVERVDRQGGGPAANAAVGLARLGAAREGLPRLPDVEALVRAGAFLDTLSAPG
jgi:hypothetical protein